MDVLISFQMYQVLTEPTRVTPISKTLCRDVVITNSKERLSHTGAYPLSISDHYLIYAIRKTGIPRGRPRFVEARFVVVVCNVIVAKFEIFVRIDLYVLVLYL